MHVVSPSLRRLLVPFLAALCVGVFALSRLTHDEPRTFTQADLWTGVVAVVLTLAALFLPAAVRGSLEGTASALPWASLFFLIAWMIGVLTQILLGPEPWFAAPAAASTVGLSVLAIAAWSWFLPMLPVYRLRKLKSDPAALDAAVGRILERLRSWNPSGRFQAKRQSQVAIAAASVLTELRRWNDASAALSCVALGQIDGYRRALVQASRAVALLYLGQRREAWNAMQDANKLAEGNPALQKSLAINAELIASLDGPPEPVLKRLDEIGRPAQLVFQRGWLLARANARAASGDSEAALGILQELASIAPDGLDRAIELGGPASGLARKLRGSRP